MNKHKFLLFLSASSIFAVFICGMFYANYFEPRLLLYPSYRIKSVREKIAKDKNEGFIIMNKIEKQYKEKEYPEIITEHFIKEWGYTKISDSQYKLEKSLFRDSRLMLISTRNDIASYIWEYFPTRKSKPEYLYVAP